jgi:hypothetical protein
MEYIRINDEGYVYDVLSTSIEVFDSSYIFFPDWPKYKILQTKPNQKFNYKNLTWEDFQGDEEIRFFTDRIIKQRQNLLYASDWTQIPNNPLTTAQQEAWAVYRQELRDISDQSGYPFNVIWPTPPQG